MLEVYNLFGTVTVIVPEGVEVVVRGGGLFASQRIRRPSDLRSSEGRGSRSTHAAQAAHCTFAPGLTPPTLKQSLKAVKRALRG